MRIEPDAGERELRHVGLGDDDGARGAQSPHDRRIARHRGRGGEHGRSGPRRLARDVEEILDADDRTVERTERKTGAGTGVRGIRGVARGLRIHGEAGASPRPFWLGDPRKRRFQSIPRRPPLDGRNLGDGGFPRRRFVVRSPAAGCDGSVHRVGPMLRRARPSLR